MVWAEAGRRGVGKITRILFHANLCEIFRIRMEKQRFGIGKKVSRELERDLAAKQGEGRDWVRNIGQNNVQPINHYVCRGS